MDTNTFKYLSHDRIGMSESWVCSIFLSLRNDFDAHVSPLFEFIKERQIATDQTIAQNMSGHFIAKTQ